MLWSIRVTSQCSHIAVDAWYCGPIPPTSALKNSVRVISKCSHIDDDV